MTPALKTILRGLDPEVVAWRAAILANGGSVGMHAVREVDRFVRGCRADGVWDAIIDMGVFVGVDDLNAALVKLKTAPGVSRVLTNFNFVSADYTASGSSAGLSGNAVNKRLDTNCAISGVQVTNLSFGAYCVTQLNESAMGARNGGQIIQLGAVAGDHMHFGNPGRVNFTASGTAGFFVGSGLSSDVRIFRNGLFDANRGSAGDTSSDPVNAQIFCNGSAEYSHSTLSFYFWGTALSDGLAAAFSSRVNILMAAFGAAVY